MLTLEDVSIDGVELVPQAAISESSAAKAVWNIYTLMPGAQRASEVHQKSIN